MAHQHIKGYSFSALNVLNKSNEAQKNSKTDKNNR